MTDTLTHAYTVRQPFAYATAVGWKPIENKTERPPLALIGQLVGIHAGLQWCRPEDMPSWPTHLYPTPAPDDPRLTYGALIGVARLVGVVRYSTRPTHHHDLELQRGNGPIWDLLSRDESERAKPWVKPHHVLWYFREAVLLPEPILMRGQQGLWRLPMFTPDGTHGDFRASWALEQWRKARETR